jgi:hypothetical protein
MPQIEGIEFDTTSHAIISDLIQRLQESGTCEVYGLPKMQNGIGEIRLAHRRPTPPRTTGRGVFARIFPNVTGATYIRRKRSATDYPRMKLGVNNLDEVFREMTSRRELTKVRQKHNEKVDPNPPGTVSGGRFESNRRKF